MHAHSSSPYSFTALLHFFVIVRPSISPEVVDLIANETEAAFFRCQATGEPVPTIRWYFNNVPVTNSIKYQVIPPLPGLNLLTLIIRNVQSSDVGTYTCNATNVVSSDTSSGVLTVNGEDYFIM